LKEEFSDIWWTKIADQWIMFHVKLRRGVQVPGFSFTDIDDSTIVYSKASLAGKIYLLDFWATWCIPCLNEIPYLQGAYRKYHSKGLEIISISSDDKKSTVERFRRHRAAMPWRHVWIGGGTLKRYHDLFEVTGIPKPILVNRNGEIVGMGAEMRGENLDKVVKKIIGD